VGIDGEKEKTEKKEKTEGECQIPETMRHTCGNLVALFEGINPQRVAIINPQGTLVCLVSCLRQYHTSACMSVASML